jgi:serine/threonine protein phosphatase PrpC
MANTPKKDDDDEVSFDLGEGVEFSDPKSSDTGEFVVEAMRNMVKTETGAAATTVFADIERKERYDQVTGMMALIPNEDAYAANTITIAENEDPGALLKRVMTYVDATYGTREDGSTITSSILSEGKLYTANMGDSPVLVVTIDPTADPDSDNAVTVKQVTRDHVASNEEERQKLPDPSLAGQDKYGRWYVYNEDKTMGTMVTRTLGNRGQKLLHEPEVNEVDLSADVKAGKQVLVITGSDGIMEKTSVGGIQNLLKLSNKLARAESQRGMHADEIAFILSSYRYEEFSIDGIEHCKRNDDTTLVVQPVTPDMLEPKIVGGKKEVRLTTLADGHGFKFEKTPDGGMTFDENFEAIPKYKKPLSQMAVNSMQKYVASPNLMQDSKILRQ